MRLNLDDLLVALKLTTAVVEELRKKGNIEVQIPSHRLPWQTRQPAERWRRLKQEELDEEVYEHG